jgi:hypothetical protein
VRADLARAVHNGKECGEVEPDADPETAAVRLLAVTEGLALQIHRAAATDELALSVLDIELAATFTGQCRQYKNP